MTINCQPIGTSQEVLFINLNMNNSDSLFRLLGVQPPIKRKIFISYHHDNDQYWYDQFKQTYAEQLSLFNDNSLDRTIDSENSDYINSTIKEDHIRGSSLTIVLTGTETWKRRWVDWEIHATLDEEHALIGIALPPGYHSLGSNGGVIVPYRLLDNLQSGYAHFIHWPNNYQVLYSAIEIAISRSNNTNARINTREKMQRSSS